MLKYKPSAAGKGSQARNVIVNSNSPLWKQVKLNSGVSLTPDEAAEALNKACELLSLLKIDEADQWIQTYYSNQK